jgi:hypothetical protein
MKQKNSWMFQVRRPIMSMDDGQDLEAKNHYQEKNRVHQYKNINRHVITRKQMLKTPFSSGIQTYKHQPNYHACEPLS